MSAATAVACADVDEARNDSSATRASNAARACAIAVGVEQAVDRCQLSRRASVHSRGVVPQMANGAGTSGDEPVAEPPLQRVALIDVPRYAVKRAGFCPRRREHQ